MSEPVPSYSGTAKIFHWLSAALIFAMVGLGLYMTQEGLGLAEKFQLYQLHKSLGVSLLLLTVMRLGVRIARPAPRLPLHMPAWEKLAAQATHGALYALVFAMTLTGWAMVSVAAFAVPTKVFGVIPWPHIPFLEALPPQEKKTLEPIFKQTHMLLAWSLTALVALHIAAALRHGLILKDGVMSRMLPRLTKTKALALLFGAMLGLHMLGTGRALAFEWEINPAKSRLLFEVNAGGQPFTGKFERFKARILFDAEEPGEMELTVSIDTASAVTGTADVDKALTQAEWFDATQYPEALFVGKGAKETGDGAYEIPGQLTLKGVTKPVTLAFTLDIDRGEATAKGSLVLKRSDFGIGPSGPVAGFVIGDEVRVKVDVAALRLDN